MWRELKVGEEIEKGDEWAHHSRLDLQEMYGWHEWEPYGVAKPHVLPSGLRYRRWDDDLQLPPIRSVIPKAKPNRKHYPVFSGFLKYFPKASRYCSHVSWKANEQHNPGEPMHWAKDKSKDHADCIIRHMVDHLDNPVDDDGLLHYGKVLWRAAALLETYLEDNDEHDPTN